MRVLVDGLEQVIEGEVVGQTKVVEVLLDPLCPV